MPIRRLLVANRGEIAVRIMRTAADRGIETVAVFTPDDAGATHTRHADSAVALPTPGAGGYLDIPAIVQAAREAQADAIHPGYGFLSERADFARAVEEAGLRFVGPTPDTLVLLGDKVAARRLAAGCGVPTIPGTDVLDPAGARAFLASLDGAPMLLKAVAGGGGRGVRVVRAEDELASAFERAASEAARAFGDGALYAERYLERARHVELQVLGDGRGNVVHLWERECSLQRRHQKVVEFAPAPGLPPGLRDRLLAASLAMARRLDYRGAGTFEFLIDAAGPLTDDSPWYFIEANARLQVEHTVTEAITGLDIVGAQLDIAGGATLADLALAEPPPARGIAVQLRVNAERMTPDGQALPASGTLRAFEPPAGPFVRVDTAARPGMTVNPAFDSLLAKVIVSEPSGQYERLLARAGRALREFAIDGPETNLGFLMALLELPQVRAGDLATRLIDDHAPTLAAASAPVPAGPASAPAESPGSAIAGAVIDTSDPLAVLAYGKAAARGDARPARRDEVEEGQAAVRAPLQGTLISVLVQPGDRVRAGQPVAVMEAMKMEHEVAAPCPGTVLRVDLAPGVPVIEGAVIAVIEPAAVDEQADEQQETIDLDHIRPDLAEVLERRARTRDERRPDAVARRHASGHRTARENIAHLCDPGTFIEYGPLVLAAQRARRSLEELIEKTPADGLITGVGSVNGHLFGDPASRCAIMAYDYTVLAGTQGGQNHRKTDRLIDVAERGRLPFILFAEGGGGRPGDTDIVASALSPPTFTRFAQLSGLVPIVGITTGRCFAGNAALLGCCDAVIATEDANIGMGGPAMIEGGGLGIFAPEEIGPVAVQVPNGVIDILVRDEAEAVEVAKQYLGYFQGRLPAWEAHDQRLLRTVVPENRLRVYNVRRAVELLCDVGSVLELRPKFGVGMITALARIEGRPIGVVANNPAHLGGAIDADAADKAARFLQLCDAFDLPVLFLCDTPGIMVGPEAEKTALVRHASRLFLAGANLSVPIFTIILRKAYGLGAIGMAGGSYHHSLFTVAWPTAEFGGMGLEGSVKLGFRNELAAIADPDERRRFYEQMVARAYERGKALNQASLFEVDDAIDPAESRAWVAGLLDSLRPTPPRDGKKRPYVDAW
ncbi:carboxyl transferase domain-containing protein [Tepidiforma sp.]|uniref:carboxyl transferase domain-containing protein n=1 Tax=Tepidiforma sp. TaxID=2682230 RepID=UPI002ADDD485|nr:carboxyl transferase domain-containing protein [Tepidiforma sp.]